MTWRLHWLGMWFAYRLAGCSCHQEELHLLQSADRGGPHTSNWLMSSGQSDSMRYNGTQIISETHSIHRERAGLLWELTTSTQDKRIQHNTQASNRSRVKGKMDVRIDPGFRWMAWLSITPSSTPEKGNCGRFRGSRTNIKGEKEREEW